MKKALNKSSENALLRPAIQHGASVLWSRFPKQRNTSFSYYILTHPEERIRKMYEEWELLLLWKLQ